MTLLEYDHLKRDIVHVIGNIRNNMPIKLLFSRDLYLELQSAFDILVYPDHMSQYFMGYIVDVIDIPGYRWFVSCGDGVFHETL